MEALPGPAPSLSPHRALAQRPSPAVQSEAVGQAVPLPLGATVCVQIRASADSQPGVQALQLPAQSLCAAASGAPTASASSPGSHRIYRQKNVSSAGGRKWSPLGRGCYM